MSYYGGSAGVYQITSFVTGQDAPWLGTYQIRANLQVGDKSRFQLNSGLFFYDKIKGLPTENGDIDRNTGNSVEVGNDGKAVYATDFHIFNHFINYIYSGLKKPLSLKAQVFHNTGASDNNIGYALGASVGDLQEKGHCRTFYQFQRVEQDADFSPIAQDDFLLATQFSGHVFSYAYAISSKVNIELWGLWSKKLEDGASFQGRYRLDVNMKF